MDDLEQSIAEVLGDYDRVDFGKETDRWRLWTGPETTVSPITTEEVACAIAKRIRDRSGPMW